MEEKELVYCIPCKKTCYHENQWAKHLSSDQHRDTLLEIKRQKDLSWFVSDEAKSGQHFMVLDLEGNIVYVYPKTPTEDKMMILLEISYLIFTYNSTTQSFEVVRTYNTLVQAGDKRKDYDPSLLHLLNKTMAHKHGISFTLCEEKGVPVQQAWSTFQEDINKYGCKRILAKGAGMEKMFVEGCQFQKNFTADKLFESLDYFVLDLEHLFKVEKISTEELTSYPNCGNHLVDVVTKELLHCSLAEVHCYYYQLIKHLKN